MKSLWVNFIFFNRLETENSEIKFNTETGIRRGYGGNLNFYLFLSRIYWWEEIEILVFPIKRKN